jgi:hypothetical protein
MTSKVTDGGDQLPQRQNPQTLARSSRQAVTEAYLDTLVLAHRRAWAAPGLMVLGRAEHFRQRLGAYLTWYRARESLEPSPVHLAVVSAQMLQFDAEEPGTRTTPSPWVRDTDFPEIWRAATETLREGETHGGR